MLKDIVASFSGVEFVVLLFLFNSAAFGFLATTREPRQEQLYVDNLHEGMNVCGALHNRRSLTEGVSHEPM